MGCFGCCFGFRRKQHKAASRLAQFGASPGTSQEHLLNCDEVMSGSGGRKSVTARHDCSREMLMRPSGGNGWRIEEEKEGKEAAVHSIELLRPKVTTHANTSQDREGNKMVNQYVRENTIGAGSYGKVVLHRSLLDNRFYAIKIFHKSRLRRIKVAPSETAMMDVLREVEIMARLNHPNIVTLVEVIDDPECDHLYMVLEYLEGHRMFEGSGPPGGIGDGVAWKYFRDTAAGLAYLHENKVIHGDIKPENLMVSREGQVKIGDFGVSRIFEDDDDLVRRSPGTPVFTAPECCKGSVYYHGRAADVWALGVTLYCMIMGRYPFVGESLQETYDKIIDQDLYLPASMDANLKDLLQRLLCKDPDARITLDAALLHPWLVKECPKSLI